MSLINKHKFLTELEKLLTFMYEEDRETAIAMYDKMFELAPDESVLISALVSPTRQAVQLARAYDANERKHDLESQDSEGQAPFIAKITEIFNDILDSLPDAEEVKPSDSKDDNAQTAEAHKESENCAEETAQEQQSEPMQQLDTVLQLDSALAVSEIEEEKSEVDVLADHVDDFLKDFKIKNAELLETQREEIDTTVAQEPVEPPTPAWKDKKPDAPAAEIKQEKAEPKQDSKQENDDIKYETKAKTKNDNNGQIVQQKEPENTKLSAAALIPYLLVAIPITALALIIIVAVAIGVLSVSAAGFIMTARILAAAFESFRVFSDVLVVTGIGFVLGGLSFLLLWTAIYLAFGLNSKMINGVINLANKLCMKKV